MKKNRVCIYPKDISLLTGKSLRHAQRMLNDIRFVLCKQKHQFVTIEEFAVYSGINIDLVRNMCFITMLMFVF